MTATEFTKALLYAEAFSKRHHSYFPYLGHTIGIQGGQPGGYHCLECDPQAKMPHHSRAEIPHQRDCVYLQFRRALAEAKKETP